MKEPLAEPRKRLRVWPILATLLFLSLIYGGMRMYGLLYKPNVPVELTDNIVQIPTGASFDGIVRTLKDNGFIIDENSFRLLAGKMEYRGRPGRFKIKPGWTNRQLIRQLRGGKQEPVNLILVNERLPEHVAAKAARFIEADSLSIISLLHDKTYLDSIGYSPQTLMSLFVPNTYEFFWNTSARQFVQRMNKENARFWKNDGREEKAAQLGLSHEEVYTLASIVERETNQNREKRRLAGGYYNRVRKRMLLQADPTLVFASRDWESRSLAKYKTLDSPYNTYMYAGLPPGPISMASISSLDAVLNLEKHKYIYFCAAGDESGTHNFAETYNGHLKNIEIYKRNLRKRGLY